MLTAYRDRIVEDVQLARPLKVVIDCGNGVGGTIATSLFRGIGCDVTELFCEVDGNFPNHHPDPSQLENLQDLIAEVKNTGAEFGMAFDGDADRFRGGVSRRIYHLARSSNVAFFEKYSGENARR